MDSVELSERPAMRQRLENSGSTSTSARLETNTLRDALADIGESIKKLQEKLSVVQSAAAPQPQSPSNLLQDLWSLLWQLRPYLFLASPATARQWNLGRGIFQQHHRGYYAKDAVHVAIALRLYVVLLRFAVICPAAALHGCLTLLSIFAVLNDPRLRSWRDSSERVQDVFLFLLRALRTSDTAACAQVRNVMQQLMSEVTVHFEEVQPDAVAVREPQRALFLELYVQPSATLLTQTDPLLAILSSSNCTAAEGDIKTQWLHDVFSVHVCVETPYEARCIEAGLLQLSVRLFEQRVTVYIPRESVTLLCDVACHLVSSAVPGTECNVVNRVQHDTAWYAIRFLTASHHLLPHVHGPLLLSLLASQLRSPLSASIFCVTLAEKSIVEWLTQMKEAELLSLAAAMDRKGGNGNRGGALPSLTMCLAQMWEIAVRWCVELFSSPACATTKTAVQRTHCALTTLMSWVGLCERFFSCTVRLTADTNDYTNNTNVPHAEYAHRLQLLANELPLSSITAALLCAQMPLLMANVADELLFLPHRILSFFAVPALPTYIIAVVEEAKNRVDVSAYRLIDANALAILSTLPSTISTSYCKARCSAQAFCSATHETLQVVYHHESPSYAFLLQAVTVMLHFFPRDDALAEPSDKEIVPGVVQELDAALASRVSNKLVLPGVQAPLWNLLYKKVASVLFRVGSGLSWTRRTLLFPEFLTLQPGSSTTEAFLSRIAGIGEGLREACRSALSSVAELSQTSHDSTIMRSALSVMMQEEEELARLRRAYDSFTNLLSVAVQLFNTLGDILCSVARCGSQWRAGSAGVQQDGDDVLSGTLLAATMLLSSVAALQIDLLEAKYTFACIAGPAVEFPKSPVRDARSSESRSKGRGKEKKSRKRKGIPTSAAVVTVVVDVDDDNEEEHNNKSDNEQEEESTVTAKNAAETKADDEEEKTSVSALAASKTQVLERIVDFHRTQLLPTVISAVQAVVLPIKGNKPSASDAAAIGNGKENAGDDAVEVMSFYAALLRVVYSTIALSPPLSVGQDVRACFSLSTILQCGGREVDFTHTLVPLAARELILWSSPDTAMTTNANTGQKVGLFLQWLAATDKLTFMLNTRPENLSSSAVEEVAQDAIDLLCLARRCFQDVRAASATLTCDKESVSGKFMLSDTATRKQETCFVACEFAVQEARGWLALCFDLYGVYRAVRSGAHDAALAVMGLCIETARDVMALFAWSATDLLRFRERPFVFSSFLKAVVDKEDRDMKVVLTASLDVLGRYLISADGMDSNSATSPLIADVSFIPGCEFTQARLKRLMEREGISQWSSAAGAVAYVLYECSGKPLEKQLQYLGEIMSCLGKTVKDVPAIVRSSKHVIAFHLVSLEADAQLLARHRRRRSGRERRSSVLSSSSSTSKAPPLLLSETAALAGHLGREAHRLFFPGGGTLREGTAYMPDEETTASVPQSRDALWVLPDGAAERDNLDCIAFSVFERAVEQMVTLCESTETVTAVEASLCKPVSRSVAAEELWKSMFAVLDSIYKAIRIEPVVRYGDDGTATTTATAATEERDATEGAQGSTRTRCRWLLGLASFIRFMGPQTTPIALMLPTLLERCSQLPSLVPFVCIVWKELVCACTEEYLAESAPSIALSLVSLEQHAAPQAESRLLLASALQYLYRRTESASFWDSYKIVLSTSSELVNLVLQARKLDKETRVGTTVVAAVAPQDDELAKASHLLAGFVEVMRSGSLQSTTVFVRALYQYLSKAGTSKRLLLSHAASQQPEVVQTLLRCSEADSESVMYAMRCISIIGAVTPPSSAAAVNTLNDTMSSASTSDSAAEAGRASLSLSLPTSNSYGAWASMTGGQCAYLDAETVMNWRKFAYTLLKDYFPRVFASTADPVLHNCIAFAVQELLRASTTQERLMNKGLKLRSEDAVHVDELERYLWWARLTPHVKQLLGGFTTTRYSLTVNWKTRLRVPEYTPSLSYRRWLFNFFNHLVVSCEGWFAEMVQPLRNVAKRNSSLILYLLPYLVVHLLESGKMEDEQYLECEMKTVLEATVDGQSCASLSRGSQSLYASRSDAAPLHEPREHAHTVLGILEDIEQLRWSMLRNRGRILCVFDQQEQTESACIHLSERYSAFLRLIPWTLRCRAALKIGSHIRALRSVECQRRIPDLATVIGAVPLQRIFAALGDRESSRSIHRTSPGLSLEDTAFSFENNGDWPAALSSSELVLQHHPSSGQHQLTTLHCMNEMGELYMTSCYAASLLASSSLAGASLNAHPAVSALSTGDTCRWKGSTTFSQLDVGVDRAVQMDVAELRSHVQAYANEAAWRLGQWDSLLPNTSTTSSSSLTNISLLTGGGTTVSLAMPAAQLQRELTGRCALPRVHAVTDVERLKIVPMIRTPCLEDLTAQGYTFTLLLHALGDVDAVSDLLCANIAILDKDGNPRGDYEKHTGRLSATGFPQISNSTTCCTSGNSCSNGCWPTPSRISAAFLPSAAKDEITTLLSLRVSYIEDTIGAREPLLSLHRMVYRELNIPQKVAETWLQQAELLRNAGLGEAALTAARQAAYECPEHIVHTNYYTLVANLLHDTQSATPAIEFARECIGDPRIPSKTRAQVQVLLTDWLVETGAERPERILAEYNKARELDRQSELVHYQMAVFNEHLHTLATNASESAAAQLTTTSPAPAPVGTGGSSGGSGGGESGRSTNASTAALYSAILMHQRETVESIHKYALPAIEHFGEALLRGTEKASVSLPRMLTLWLDSAAFLGSLTNTTAGKLDGSAAGILDTMNTKVRTFILSTVGATIPPGVVMTALPQLLSRLAHPVPAVRAVLTDVVVHLLNCFPQQCLWLVLPMALSKEGPKEIVETQIIKPFADNPRNERVLRSAKIICDTLLAICNCSASLFPKERGLTQLSPVEKINPILPDANFVLPILSNFTPNINADELAGVFPTSPCFHHFEDRVVIMRSLQKPKRIWVVTSEGQGISFLCKAKDEPRKDIRMMEVATLMNSFFLSDPEARRKRFSLRRYSVTALCDDCAVIEWLNDTSTLAKVAMESYSLDRSGVHISSVKKWVTLVDDKKLSKRDLFTKYILPEAPPVMHQWLDRTFTSNQSWYEARNLFTQSAALWSIAGHIVGLGDRHAENLMIDTKCGEVMHVDFACMFDKGEKLEVPEQVRFRLTQNLTDVMGILGAYGPFQATCEVALRCEMKNKSAVMSIVETLLHEPLVEWRRQSSRSSLMNGPKQLMERVARRLDGFLDLYSVPPRRDTLALNVESQVAKLIHHSSDLDNLSQMYIWWMAWI